MGAGSPNKMATTGGVSSANLSSERIRGLSELWIVYRFIYRMLELSYILVGKW